MSGPVRAGGAGDGDDSGGGSGVGGLHGIEHDGLLIATLRGEVRIDASGGLFPEDSVKEGSEGAAEGIRAGDVGACGGAVGDEGPARAATATDELQRTGVAAVSSLDGVAAKPVEDGAIAPDISEA